MSPQVLRGLTGPNAGYNGFVGEWQTPGTTVAASDKPLSSGDRAEYPHRTAARLGYSLQVRILPKPSWGLSSIGRAPVLQAGCSGFDTHRLHRVKAGEPERHTTRARFTGPHESVTQLVEGAASGNRGTPCRGFESRPALQIAMV